MRIGILVKEYPPDVIGGAEIQTKQMAEELTARGHEVTVYTKSYPGSEPHNPDYELVRLPTWHLNGFVSTLTFLISAFFTLLWNRRKHDILQCMMIYPNGFLGYVINRLTGLPYFAWIRGGDFYFMKDTPIKRWMISTVLDDRLVLTQTENVIEDVRAEFPNAELRAITNGVKVPEETVDGDALVFVGRLKEQKGVDRLIRIAGGVDTSVLIVGDGPQREALESLADDLGVDAEFVGEVPPSEVPRYLQRGSVFVLPSRWGEGGAPNAVLEAMAAGLPVVVTSTGGMMESIANRKIGYLVDADDTGTLQKRIETLLSDGNLRHEMGANARAYVRNHHSFEVTLAKLEGVYKEIINREKSV